MKNVVIRGSTARAIGADGRLDTTVRHRSVKDAWEAAQERGFDPDEMHVDPFCNEPMPWEAFKAHMAECVERYVPRRKVWTPPGVEGALAVFPEKRRFGEVG